jgi:broad specificity phosphatase PhoE
MFGDTPPEQIYFTTDDEVREWDYGKYEGALSKDIKKERPNWSIWDDGCPDGESPKEMSDRVDRVIAKVRKIHVAVCISSLSYFG